MELNDPMTDELFLFDRVWFPKVFKYSREAGLDWLRMCAAAEVLSDGDPRKRVIDWEYIKEYIGLDSPVFSSMYDELGLPSAEIIDRGTRWGLFQLVGQRTIDYGHTGRLVNLIDITKNVQTACNIMTQLVRQAEKIGNLDPSVNLQRIAEESLNWPVDLIDLKVAEFKIQMGNLLTFGD